MPRLPASCPVCQSASIVPIKGSNEYRCLKCRAAWVMGTLPPGRQDKT
jgi:transposase-like protein